jgi:hypothetical protein
MQKFDITSLEGLNKANADLRKQIREARFALSALELASTVSCLEQGLVTTVEMMNKAVDIAMRSLDNERLLPGDIDLITGQVIPTDQEDQVILKKITD